MKVTCVEVSKAPVEPRIFYVLFDDPKKAAEFVDEVKEDYNFHFLESYEDDEKKDLRILSGGAEKCLQTQRSRN